MRGSIPLFPQYVFMAWCLIDQFMAWYLVKHGDNFTFCLISGCVLLYVTLQLFEYWSVICPIANNASGSRDVD
jgi:hypothetical protein